MTSTKAKNERAPIPVVDLAGCAARPSADVVATFGRACETIGFLVVSNHSVPAGLLDGVTDVSRQFFRQPPAVKESYASPTGNRFRGFKSGGRYLGGPVDLKEGFQASLFDDGQAMIDAGYPLEYAADFEPNIWPSDEFRTVWRAYMDEVKQLGQYILQIAALALGLEADWFAPKFTRESSYLLANYYPPQFIAPEGGSTRLHAHTDYGGFTILYQDTAEGGLEVESRAGSWVRVPAEPGTYIVNLGDMLANWTNGRWVATRHRVRNTGAGEAIADRISIPFFQHPNLDAVIDIVPTCLDEGEVPKYEPVEWRDWASRRMSELKA